MGIQVFTLASFGQATKGSKAQLKAKWCGAIFQTQPWWDSESSCGFSLAIPNPLFWGWGAAARGICSMPAAALICSYVHREGGFGGLKG